MRYTIFIDPLPLSFTATDLIALVQPFGPVVSANVVRDSLGTSLRFGYVKMETAEAADNVCKNLNRTVLDCERLTLLPIDGMDTPEVEEYADRTDVSLGRGDHDG
jgi:RNA recognition motif-containing protein